MEWLDTDMMGVLGKKRTIVAQGRATLTHTRIAVVGAAAASRVK
jgi:hypothetical protein